MIPKVERGVACRGGDSQPSSREARDPARQALRPGCEELAGRIRSKCRRRKRGTGAQNRHGGAPGGERPALWDARRLDRRLACRVTCRPNGVPRKHPYVSRRSATPHWGQRSESFKTRAQKRAAGTRRCCLVLRLSVRHSGRAAIAASAGIHNHGLWVWIPGSRALPAARNDASESKRGPV